MTGTFNAEIGKTRGDREPVTYIRIATAVTKHEAVNTLVLARGGVYAPITRDGQTYRMVPRSR
jgi:hypothetical protein